MIGDQHRGDARAGPPTTLFLCGDVMLGRGIDQIHPQSCPPRLHERFVTSALDYVALAERRCGVIPRGVGCDYVWGVLPDVVAREGAGARIVNLETSITLRESAAPKEINYRMHPGNVGVLSAARIDCCVLANNHVLDWGADGLLDTLEALGAAGIRVAGAGRDLDEARQPAVIQGESGRVLVFAFAVSDAGVPTEWAADDRTPGVHLLPHLSSGTVDEIAALVDSVKRAGDLVVGSVHWGSNFGYGIPSVHRRFAHALIERAGIDIVHCHSSHHPKAIEIHGGQPILYGCGDLVNDYEGIAGSERYRPQLVLAYFPTLAAGELLRMRMVPLRLRRFRLEPATPDESAWLREVMDRECRRFGSRVDAAEGALELRPA